MEPTRKRFKFAPLPLVKILRPFWSSTRSVSSSCHSLAQKQHSPISKGYIYLNVSLIKKQDSTDKSNFFEQKHKYKQEEPHYMKSIPCIYEHEHEQRHHSYKEGSPVQSYNQNHTNANEINTFSRIPFGLEK
jgi:hypothetical protein